MIWFADMNTQNFEKSIHELGLLNESLYKIVLMNVYSINFKHDGKRMIVDPILICKFFCPHCDLFFPCEINVFYIVVYYNTLKPL